MTLVNLVILVNLVTLANLLIWLNLADMVDLVNLAHLVDLVILAILAILLILVNLVSKSVSKNNMEPEKIHPGIKVVRLLEFLLLIGKYQYKIWGRKIKAVVQNPLKIRL